MSCMNKGDVVEYIVEETDKGPRAVRVIVMKSAN